MTRRSMKTINIILIILVVIITVVPLYIAKGSEFGGADGKAEELITEINPEYQPWFSSLFNPPSSEIESLLFALQAAIGAFFIGYYLGAKRNKRVKEE